jgi:hypothetical protein
MKDAVELGIGSLYANSARTKSGHPTHPIITRAYAIIVEVASHIHSAQFNADRRANRALQSNATQLSI